jgi:hypothetical protein
MYRIKVILIGFLLIIQFACEESSTDTVDSHSVSGFISYKDKPLEGVTVSIDDQYNWTVSTDENGFFEISAVTSGSHNLKMYSSSANLNKTSDDTLGFSEKKIEISVFDDLVLENLKLPKAVKLYKATEISGSSSIISWSPTDDIDFREYKLFRHHSSGLDETTGTLIHVSTSITDTIFADVELNPYEKYYYRVYVMNEYGRIGGSNIIDIQTLNVQLIYNGSFEEIENLDVLGWTIQENSFGNLDNYIVLDTKKTFEGNNSLRFHHAEESGCWEQWITQNIDYNNFVAMGKYKISFAFMSESLKDYYYRIILRNNTFDLTIPISVVINSTNEWEYSNVEFGLPEYLGHSNIQILIHFCNMGQDTWWIDNLDLERIQ